MKSNPVKVKFVKSYGNIFEVKFSDLDIPMTVNKYYYQKMVNSPKEFLFI